MEHRFFCANRFCGKENILGRGQTVMRCQFCGTANSTFPIPKNYIDQQFEVSDFGLGKR